MTPKLKMTPLYWASYKGDLDLVKLLLSSGAIMIETVHGITPVDIAGFCGKKTIVTEFADHLAKKIN
jgi:ankyrin repeat protein